MLIPFLLSALFFGVCVIFLHSYIHIVLGILWSHCFNLMIGDGYTYTSYIKVFQDFVVTNVCLYDNSLHTARLSNVRYFCWNVILSLCEEMFSERK